MTKDGSTRYFLAEGRDFMRDCIHCSLEWAVQNGVTTIVMFTGTGEGPHYAAKEVLRGERYKSLKLVAVTPPAGRPYKQNPADPDSPLVRSGINPAMKDELAALGIAFVSAHLPFKEVFVGSNRESEWKRVELAFGVLGGGFALCLQAVMIATDAGEVDHGERVVALTADTAIEVVNACRTETFLSPREGMLVGHVIARPSTYTISKPSHEVVAARTPAVQEAQRLPPSPPQKELSAPREFEAALEMPAAGPGPEPKRKARPRPQR